MVISEAHTVSGTGDELMFTVPDTDHWNVHFVNCFIGGVFTVYAIKVLYPINTPFNMDTMYSADPTKWVPNSSATIVYYPYINTAASVVTMDGNYKSFTVAPRTKIYIVVDAFTSSGALTTVAQITRWRRK